ncbi:hypothetical protein MASR2M17_21910 [Aminivibrio sp.]
MHREAAKASMDREAAESIISKKYTGGSDLSNNFPRKKVPLFSAPSSGNIAGRAG